MTLSSLHTTLISGKVFEPERDTKQKPSEIKLIFDLNSSTAIINEQKKSRKNSEFIEVKTAAFN